MKLNILFIGLLFLITCEKESSPIGPIEESSFGIYLLKDKSLTIDQISDTDISRLEVESSPWLSASDIAFYDASSHYIYLNETSETLFTIESNINWNGQPFVVFANDKRCYVGAFHSSYSSLALTAPYIDQLNIQMLPEDILAISSGIETDDVRNDENVFFDLAAKKKLHKGLSLSLKDIQLLANADSAVVQYTFVVNNKDSDPLYVLDCDKMGSNLFHYYVIGLNFNNGTEHFSSDYQEVTGPEPYDTWNPEWFTKISSGHSIERTVVLKGYPHIPCGTYTCSFSFSAPVSIDSEQRELADGRYWLGIIDAKTFFNVTER